MVFLGCLWFSLFSFLFMDGLFFGVFCWVMLAVIFVSVLVKCSVFGRLCWVLIFKRG